MTAVRCAHCAAAAIVPEDWTGRDVLARVAYQPWCRYYASGQVQREAS